MITYNVHLYNIYLLFIQYLYIIYLFIYNINIWYEYIKIYYLNMHILYIIYILINFSLKEKDNLICYYARNIDLAIYYIGTKEKGTWAKIKEIYYRWEKKKGCSGKTWTPAYNITVQ